MTSESKCPVTGSTRGHANRDWWPNQLNLKFCTSAPPCPIRWAWISTNAKEFESLDLNAVIKDLHALMTDSQE
jgi:catalase-peroxidase